jgi:outer membrane protein TolC
VFAAGAAAWSVPAGLQAAEIAARADVQAAWQRLLATHHEAARLRLERFPRLTLTGSGGWASAAFRQWIGGSTLGWTLGLRLNLPLLDGGRLGAQVQQAQAQALEREADYRKTVLQALFEVHQALLQVELADTEVDIAGRQLARRSADLETLERRRAAGLTDRLALADAERARIQGEEELLRARRARALAVVTLHRALGSPV